MKLGRHEIGPDRTFIIAEAGTNFVAENLLGRAIRYVIAAKACGADAVKFQMFVPDELLFCPVDGDEKRWTRWNQTLLTLEQWNRIKEICDYDGIVFLASAFQPTAVQWLKELGVEAYKVASRARDTYPYDSVPGPFITSFDASILNDYPRHNEILLHCVPKYPAPWEVDSLFPVDFTTARGLSDHTGNIWAGLHAITHGAPMLEVHFSIHDDKRDAGPDAPVCLTVDQLKFLCSARDAFAALRS